ncbi:MAG TPA: NAD-dependent epimerase/dehydratase family protein [Rhodothermales bacterium]|nr:NAD-dependent epimerase/dehydratase family protein [Rhodothermales bacterium]
MAELPTPVPADPPRTALLLGATGLVGGHLLDRLAADGRWGRVVTLGRRPMEAVGARHEHHVVDFERLADSADAFRADDVFCALGTTIRQAGSQTAFRRVDLDYPFLAAQMARHGGARQFLLVSALSADANSRIFYSRIKGQLEVLVGEVGFDSVGLFRPSFIVGERAEKRSGEGVASGVLTVLRPVLVGPLRKLRPNPADTIAQAMVAVAARPRPGVHVYSADRLEGLAAEGAA